MLSRYHLHGRSIELEPTFPFSLSRCLWKRVNHAIRFVIWRSHLHGWWPSWMMHGQLGSIIGSQLMCCPPIRHSFSLLYNPFALSHTYDWVLSMVGPSDMFDSCDGSLSCLCQILWKWVNCAIRFVMWSSDLMIETIRCLALAAGFTNRFPIDAGAYDQEHFSPFPVLFELGDACGCVLFSGRFVAAMRQLSYGDAFFFNM